MTTIAVGTSSARLRLRTDAELVRAAVGQETGAYEELFRRWYDRSYDVALNILRDRDAAADVAQDAFIIGWERLGDLRDPAAFGGWVLRATRNRALNWVTRDRFRRTEQFDAHPEAPALRDLDADPARQAERSDQRRLVWTAVAALGARDASLLDLHLRHGLGPTEIADELQVTPNNAKQLLFQLRRKLREAIGAVLLWRNGNPTCGELAALVERTGPFDNGVARTIRRHQSGCETCRREIARQTNPERLFAAAPLAAAPLALKERAVSGLIQAGVPLAPHGAAGSAATGSPGLLGATGRVPVVVGAALVALSVLLAVILSPLDPGPRRSEEPGVPATPFAFPSEAGPEPSTGPEPISDVAATVPGARSSAPGSVRVPGTGATRTPATDPAAAAGPTTVAPGAGISFCRYSFGASSDGRGHFTGQFVLTNVSNSAWNHWTAAFAVATPMTVRNSWGGVFAVAGSSVTVTPMAYSRFVPAGSTIVVGLSGTTASSVPLVSDFAVEGHTCQRR